MSLLDSASLIVTPNGYKEGKLYSVIPSDGSGDMSVVRATTATRVNSSGLVELVPYNLVQQSNTFNVTWASAGPGATTTIGQTDPDGGSNAWLLTKLGQTGRIQQSLNVGGVQTFFIYAKKNTSDFIQITIFDGIAVHECWFNLSTGVVGAQNSSTGAIESVGAGWYKCSITSTNNAAAGIIQIYLSDNDGTITGTTGSVYIFNSQLNEGSTALPYQKTETRLNIPRLDYSNGTCPSLLVEPQRTNLVTYSSSFDLWSQGAVSITVNNNISPSGIQDADLITANGANTQHYIQKGVSQSAKTYSVFAKMGTQRYIQILTSGTAAPVANFDLQDGVANMVGSNSTASIIDLGNGWWRCILQTNDSLAGDFYINYADSLTMGRFGATISSGTLYLWGAQAEVGNYPTSYIPTTSASVTRNADVISKTGISSLIGQTEGTLFQDIYIDNILNAGSYFNFQLLGTSGNVIAIAIYSDGRIQFAVLNGGALQVNIDLPSFGLTAGHHKFAAAYKNNDFVFYVDGVQVGSDTSGSVPATTKIDLSDTANGKQKYNAAALWQTRLTNDELERLTGTGFNTYAEMANYYNYITQ